MKAQELRIGNLFQEQNTKEIIEVIGLEKNRIVFSGMFLDKWQAEPIQLTENIYDKIQKQLIDAGFGYGFNEGKITIYLSDEWEFEFEYLHDLQNWYYWNNNKKELHINL